jgi:hypothetical protein
MSIESKPKHGKLAAGALWGIGACVAYTSAKALCVDWGWIERSPKFEAEVRFATPLALILGLYVAWQSMQRMQAAKKAREQDLSEWRERLKRARERTPSV